MSASPRATAIDDTLRAALAGSVHCRLDDTGVLAVGGADAAAFLNGQFSNDIAALRPGDACLSAYSDARGRVLAVPRVFAEPGRLLLVLPAERLGPIRGQLAKYVLRARVHIEDLSAEYRCLGVAGQNAAVALAGAVDGLPPDPWAATVLPSGGGLARLPGTRLRWLAVGPSASLAPIEDALEGHAARAPAEAWRLLDIEAALPVVHDATAQRFVAQMLNLDRLGALDFRKGCYPGQEVIARTRYLGRIKRRMHVLRAHADPVPSPGTPVCAVGEGSGESAGEIVDAARHPDSGSLALAVLRLEHATGPLAIGEPDGPLATVTAPPCGLDEAD